MSWTSDANIAYRQVRYWSGAYAQANQIRGLLSEFGLIIPQGIGYIATRVPELIEDASNELPGAFRLLIQRLLDHLKELDRQVDELELQIVRWHRESDASSKLANVPGIGPITASALVASLGDAKNFDGGRQVAAWLGLVPRQHSSGGKQNLLGMSKRGDTYLRTLLIHGARSVIYRAQQKPDSCSWINGVVNRRNKNVAAVALATRMHALCGRCWPMTGSSNPTTRPPRRPHSRVGLLDNNKAGEN